MMNTVCQAHTAGTHARTPEQLWWRYNRLRGLQNETIFQNTRLRLSSLICADPTKPITDAIVIYHTSEHILNATYLNKTHNMPRLLLDHLGQECFQDPKVCKRVDLKCPVERFISCIVLHYRGVTRCFTSSGFKSRRSLP